LFNLRATTKLLSRLKSVPAAAVEPTTRLGDWYANLFNVGRQQFAMFTSDRSLLTVVLPAKEIRPLPMTLTDRLLWLLRELEVPTALINDELAQMHTCTITTTASRSVLGSMHDHTMAAKIIVGESPTASLVEFHRYLAKVPLKAIGYRYPRDVALNLLSGASSSG
jgi:hypothetical protein